MNKQVKMMGAFILGSTVLFAACGQSMEGEAKNVVEKKYEQKKNRVSGQKAMALLSSTNWQGTKVYDENGTDLTSENQNFIGLAKYEADTGRYEKFCRPHRINGSMKQILVVMNFLMLKRENREMMQGAELSSGC
ncbi:putative lipoprotein [Listeria fleischmannii subsp. coloradonensis]|nr:putative lipoprotein [Listeria fleischmannii subsp. coloradonensis]